MSDYKLEWKGKDAEKKVNKGAVQGLKAAAEFILDESLKLVPLDEGTLANSGNTSVDEGAMEATVSYDTPYAVRMHEDTTLRHKNGRKAKYLEDPYKQNISTIKDFIANAIAGETE